MHKAKSKAIQTYAKHLANLTGRSHSGAARALEAADCFPDHPLTPEDLREHTEDAIARYLDRYGYDVIFGA